MVAAVDQLHRLGFFHRHLIPAWFFTTNDAEQPFILSDHDFTTPSSNKNKSSSIVDNKYKISIQGLFAGDRR